MSIYISNHVVARPPLSVATSLLGPKEGYSYSTCIPFYSQSWSSKGTVQSIRVQFRVKGTEYKGTVSIELRVQSIRVRYSIERRLPLALHTPRAL